MTHGVDPAGRARGGHVRLAHLPLPRVALPVTVVDLRAVSVPVPRAVPAPERLPWTAG